jgi:16S rRNA (cytidine1402-2'-O)-methyltransferase
MKATPDTAASFGTLFVVATPIGNLEDITLRALRVLRESALVAAEDTRRTGNLLRHYQIQTPIISLHEHNERARAGRIIDRLKAGASIALVSDAGTPGISDPGAGLVRAVRDAGCEVEAIPGPSAVTAALSAAGIPGDRFVFAGFPPTRSKDREKWFQWVNSIQDLPIACFEAPHRIRRTLEDCRKYFGKRPIIMARELTKSFEEWLEGPASSLLENLHSDRGEFVFVLAPLSNAETEISTVADDQVAHVFGLITENGAGSRREAVKRTAEQLRITPKRVYEALERHKNLSNNQT